MENHMSEEEWKKEILRLLNLLVQATQKQQKAKLLDIGLIDTEEAAEMMKVTPRTVKRWRDNGQLPYIKLGRQYFYRISDLKEMVTKGFDRK